VAARFSAPVQTGPGSHPASYKMGTGSYPGVKRTRLGVDHPPSYSAEVKERVQLYLYSPSGTSRVTFTFTFTIARAIDRRNVDLLNYISVTLNAVNQVLLKFIFDQTIFVTNFL